LKQGLLVVALLLLLVVGAAAAYVAFDPVGAGRLIGLQKQEQESARSVAVAPAGSEGAKTPPARRPATSEGKTASREPAAKPSSGGGASKPSSTGLTRRPPRREEAKAAAASAEETAIKITRKGRYIGPTERAPLHSAPLPEMYPFTVLRRTFPDARRMTVELAVRNSSGVQWRTAYVVIRSTGYEVPQQFEINDWQIDEIVGLDYTFPREEADRRLQELRIVSVSGDQRESALADIFSQSRRKWMEVSSNSRNTKPVARHGDSLSAPGMLALVGRLQQPTTGIAVQMTQQSSPEDLRLLIKVPPALLLSREPEANVRETSEERLAASRLLMRFHESGLAAEKALQEFVEALNQQSFRQAMSGEGGRALAEARRKLKEFNDLGVELATMIQRSKDAEVKKANTVLKDHSAKILGQIEEIQNQVRRVDAHFQVQPAT